MVNDAFEELWQDIEDYCNGKGDPRFRRALETFFENDGRIYTEILRDGPISANDIRKIELKSNHKHKSKRMGQKTFEKHRDRLLILKEFKRDNMGRFHIEPITINRYRKGMNVIYNRGLGVFPLDKLCGSFYWLYRHSRIYRYYKAGEWTRRIHKINRLTHFDSLGFYMGIPLLYKLPVKQFRSIDDRGYKDVSLKRGTFYHIVALDHFTRCNEKEKTLNPLAEVRLDFIARFLDASVHYYVFSQEDTIISDYPHGTESNTIYVLKSTVETLTEVEIKINRGEK